MNMVRAASILDIPLLARHRAAMFRDMGTLAAGSEEALVRATETYLRDAMPRNEYLAWVAQTAAVPPEIIGGAGVQLRPLLPRPGIGSEELELGPEATVLNVYVEPPWRRCGVAERLLQTVLTALAERRIRRIVLHASADGRRLYERLGFAPTNEMQLITGPIR